MWKLSNSMLPDSINLLFSKCNKDISGHENDYVLPAINTESKRRFISFNGIKVWKRIPNHLKTIKIFHKFKKDFSKHLQFTS